MSEAFMHSEMLIDLFLPQVHFAKQEAFVSISFVRFAPLYPGLSRSTGPRAAVFISLQLWQPLTPADWA